MLREYQDCFPPSVLLLLLVASDGYDAVECNPRPLLYSTPHVRHIELM